MNYLEMQAGEDLRRHQPQVSQPSCLARVEHAHGCLNRFPTEPVAGQQVQGIRNIPTLYWFIIHLPDS